MNQLSSTMYSDSVGQASYRAARPAMVVHLHVAIPSAKENQIVPLNLWQHVKLRLHRALDWSAWLLAKKFLFKSYNYAGREYSNRGDIAIKLVIMELIRAQFLDREVIFTESEWGNLNPVIVEKINRQAALFVIAGGGYWVFDHAQNMSPSFMADFPYFNQISCPLVVLGSGVNFNMPQAGSVISFNIDPQLRSALLLFDQRVDLLAVRCRRTHEFFQTLGLKKTSLLCDPAVFKAMSLDQIIDRGSKTLAVGINLAFHGQFVERMLQQNIQIYITFLKQLSRNFQCQFYYFIHSDEEFLIINLLRSAGIKLQIVDVPVKDLADAYRQIDVLFCQMMHANILSFCAGVPALNIAYDAKNIGFNELIDMQIFCISAYQVTVENLLEKMTLLIEQRTELKTRIVSRKAALYLEMQDMLKKMAALVAAHQTSNQSAPDGIPVNSR